MAISFCFFFSSRRRHTRCALVTGVQTCALPIFEAPTIERLRDGIRVVLAGAPNAGKSTLLNVLAERDAAIVSPISGTTRDRIDIPVARDVIPYLLTDTAGLRDASDHPHEAIGIDPPPHTTQPPDIMPWLDRCTPPPAGCPLPSPHQLHTAK